MKRTLVGAAMALALAACAPYVEPDPSVTPAPPEVPIEVVDERSGSGYVTMYRVEGRILVCVEALAGTGVAISCNWLPEDNDREVEA